MLARHGTGPNLCGDRGGTGKVVKGIGKCRTTFKAPRPNYQEAIRAELAWSDHATALGIVARSGSPVLKLCRMLLAAGVDPALRLECYRGGVLALTVNGIGQGARLTMKSAGNGAPMFALDEARRGATAPPVRRKAAGHG